MPKDKPDKPVIGRSPSDAAALALHKRAKERRDHEGTIGTAKVQRPALLKNIDFSKADPLCTICGGRGIKRYEVIKGGVVQRKGFRSRKEPDQMIPVLCDCVIENGGVKADQFDKMKKRLAGVGGGDGKKRTIH